VVYCTHVPTRRLCALHTQVLHTIVGSTAGTAGARSGTFAGTAGLAVGIGWSGVVRRWCALEQLTGALPVQAKVIISNNWMSRHSGDL
jgi:hypothetical protein